MASSGARPGGHAISKRPAHTLVAELKLLSAGFKPSDAFSAAVAAQRDQLDALLNQRATKEGLGGLHVLADAVRVRNDGNCLLDTLLLLHHMAGNQMQAPPLDLRDASARAFREQLVVWLRANEALVVDGLPLREQALAFQQYATWADMCNDFARDGVYLENAAIQAAACLLGRDIFLLHTQLSGVFSYWASGDSSRPANAEALYIGNWAMLHYVPMHFVFAGIHGVGSGQAAGVSSSSSAAAVASSSCSASLEQQGALLDALNPELLAAMPEFGDDAVKDVVKLRQQFTVLLLGFMGSGKTSLINALIGMPIMPLAAEGDVKSQTDTLCLVEFWNDPHMPQGEFAVDITLKDNKTWASDWAAFMQTITPEHFRVSVAANQGSTSMIDDDDGFGDAAPAAAQIAPEFGARYGTDMLRALHHGCFEPGATGDAERATVLKFVNDPAQEILNLSNDARISAVRARGRIELRVSNVQLLSDLLSRLTRAFSSEDKAREQRLLSSIECKDALELLQLGEPWPLIRIISVRANARHSQIPPFCRLIDSPGLGVDESVTGIDTLQAIQRALHDRQLSEVWYVQSYERNMASKSFRDDLLRLKTSIGLENVRFVITKSDVQKKTQVDRQFYASELNAKVTDIMMSAGMKTDAERDVLNKRTHFVSAQGYALHRGWQWFPGVVARQFALAECVPTIVSSRVEKLFQRLNSDIWGQIHLMHLHYEFVVNNSVMSLCSQLSTASSSAAAAVQPASSCQSILQEPAVKVAQRDLERTVANFMQHVSTFRLDPNDSSTVINHTAQHLSRLRSQTVKAIMRRGGSFQGHRHR